MTQRPKRQRRTRERGQAMVEYSMINWLLIVAIVLALTVRMIPGPPDPNCPAGSSNCVQRRNVIEMFLDAYQKYYNSFFFVLNLPYP